MMRVPKALICSRIGLLGASGAPALAEVVVASDAVKGGLNYGSAS
jgi:hypothetical protein